MKKLAALMAGCVLAVVLGCSSEPDITKDPNFKDTSNPSEVKMGEGAPAPKK